jgi:YggT family protein
VLSIIAFVINTAASVLGGILLLRFWMQAIHVRAPTQVSQFAFKLTDWLVLPLRRFVPGTGGYDWASLLGAFLIMLVASLLLLVSGMSLVGVVLFALQRLLGAILFGFMALLIIEAIFSWVNPNAPLAPFVRALNEPLLRPLRRVIPLIGGLDLSLLAALLLLQVAQMVVGVIFGVR